MSDLPSSDLPSLDLSRYQTQALTEKITDILSIPEAIGTVLRTAVLTLLLLGVANAWLFSTLEGAIAQWLLTTLYTIAIALILGTLLGLLRVANTLLTRTQDLLILILEISQSIANDYRDVQTGDKQMPPATVIVEHVYDTIVLPALEGGIANTLGVLGAPLLWIYRLTVGSCVRALIKRMNQESMSPSEQKDIQRQTKDALSYVERNIKTIEATLTKAQRYISVSIQTIRKFLLWPLQLVFAGVVVVAIAPILLLWILSR